jgi:hypothetical protein
MIKRQNTVKQTWTFHGSLLIPLAVVFGRVDPIKSRSFDLSSSKPQRERQYDTNFGRNVKISNLPWERPSSLGDRTRISRDDPESSNAESILEADDDERHLPLAWDDFDQNALESNFTEAEVNSDLEIPSTEEQQQKETVARSAFPESSSLSTPVVYRYYGRNRARLRSAGSIPFILLGPSVDHWKNAAQLLAARGFSVIACERVLSSNVAGSNNNTAEEGANVVLTILDALRWSRVVLVGCDYESALAMHAALQLAPHRIAGLVLCGELQEAYRLVTTLQPSLKSGGFALDYFLQNFLEAPFAIIWDGEMQVVENDIFRDASSGNRCLILGGGSAPHRRRPEQFAWALTRFVEQKVAPTSIANLKIDAQTRRENTTTETSKRLSLPLSLQEIFSPGTGLLVSGRVVASIIFYFAALKVALYQYENFRLGLLGIKSKYETISSVQRRVLLFVRDFFLNYGYLWKVWRYIRPRVTSTDAKLADEEEENGSENDGEQKEEESDHDSTEENNDETTEPQEDYQPEFRPSFFLDQVIA